jgi:hypothetical protein
MMCILFVRYGGVPVDFEEVQMDPKSENNEDLEYAITSIKRNGVALKGNEMCVCDMSGVHASILIPSQQLFISFLSNKNAVILPQTDHDYLLSQPY